MATRRIELAVFVCLVLGACAGSFKKRLLYDVDDGVEVGAVADPSLTEASGLCASRVHPDILYTHNDHDISSVGNQLYVLDANTAQVVGMLTVDGVINNDWEDIACGPCYGDLTQNCIYIGDMGSASGEGSIWTIYRLQEPATIEAEMTASVDANLVFTWDEEDAETLLVTPDAELFVIAKIEGGGGRIVQLPSSGWDSETPVDVIGDGHLDVTSDHRDPEGGDISPDGQEILIKLRNEMLYYYMNGGTDYAAVLAGTPYSLPYIVEEKGQAVAFSADGNRYYTIGEAENPVLYKYTVVE